MNVRVRAQHTRATGSHYEDLALAYLQDQGLNLIERNFTCRFGEIDLIMRAADVLVFVEVRYRHGAQGFGDGIDSISAAKRGKLVRAARMFLATHPHLADHTCRFDVLAIAGAIGAPHVTWLPNAFDA